MLLTPLRHRDAEKSVVIAKPLCLRVSVVIRVLGFFRSFNALVQGSSYTLNPEGAG